jgi:hypothetical protein
MKSMRRRERARVLFRKLVDPPCLQSSTGRETGKWPVSFRVQPICTRCAVCARVSLYRKLVRWMRTLRHYPMQNDRPLSIPRRCCDTAFRARGPGSRPGTIVPRLPASFLRLPVLSLPGPSARSTQGPVIQAESSGPGPVRAFISLSGNHDE